MLITTSCSKKQVNKDEKQQNLVQYDSIEFKENTLKIRFSNGELKREWIPIQDDNCYCRLVEDTLKLQGHTRAGFVGGTFDLSIFNDSIYLKAIKWSCTYTCNYKPINSNIVLNSNSYTINDSIVYNINATLLLSDSSRNEVYIDSLQIKGLVKPKIREKDFYKKEKA